MSQLVVQVGKTTLFIMFIAVISIVKLICRRFGCTRRKGVLNSILSIQFVITNGTHC